MDIIDIMLARAMTPQGKTEIYLNKANKAAAKAEAAEESAEAAVATVNAAAEDITAAQTAAEELLATAQEALETAQEAQINTLDTEDVDDEIKKMDVSVNLVNGQNANTYQVITTYPDNTLHTENATKMYKSTGSNEDGTMTQKAITDALDQKANTTILNNYASISYVNQAIANIPAGGGSGSSEGGTINTDLGSENEGKIVVIDENGNIISGTVTEDAIIEALIINGGYVARDAVGLEMDYVNKTADRTQEAASIEGGSAFDSYPMFGGRKRCIVNDSGEIIAFYGEESYVENNPAYQVMVYQPKFYYQRIPLRTTGNRIGKIVEKDSLMVSYTQQNGFKLHPLFIDPDGNELDYVLIGAYEGGLYSASEQTTYQTVTYNVDFNADKLVSQAGVKPLTGSSNLTMQKAEQLATNRGAGWHIYTIEAESANQMLELIELGTPNGQSALGNGVSNISTSGSYNQAALTGATSSLGNGTGAAAETIIETNGSRTTETANGKVSISYRGLENPWGNTWTMLGGIMIFGNGASNGGIPYICKNYNYSYSSLTNDYEGVGFSLPNNNGWIYAFGYGAKKYDWLFMPAEVGNGANSVLPIGDNGWYDANLSGYRLVAHGGSWSFENSNGLFYYACDKAPNDSTYKSYGARLMFVPTKNAIYNANIAKWQATMN